MDREVLECKAKFCNKAKGQKFPYSNQIVVCGVITHNRDKALFIMNIKGATIKSQSLHRIEWELNNEKWIWRNWNESCRGYRFYKVIIDENIDDDVFRYIIAPHLAYCCSFEIMEVNYMQNLDKAFEYACNKYYRVFYNTDYGKFEHKVEGLLLNYTGGNTVLLSDKGIYHIKYKNIVYMEPIEPRTDNLDEEFKELLKSFKIIEE